MGAPVCFTYARDPALRSGQASSSRIRDQQMTLLPWQHNDWCTLGLGCRVRTGLVFWSRSALTGT